MCLTLANAATIGHHTDPTGTAGLLSVRRLRQR